MIACVRISTFSILFLYCWLFCCGVSLAFLLRRRARCCSLLLPIYTFPRPRCRFVLIAVFMLGGPVLDVAAGYYIIKYSSGRYTTHVVAPTAPPISPHLLAPRSPSLFLLSPIFGAYSTELTSNKKRCICPS